MDYFLIDTRITIDPDTSVESIQTTFVVDGLVLEGLETANLVLRPLTPLPDNFFLAPDTLLLEIEDGDGEFSIQAIIDLYYGYVLYLSP